MAWSKDIDVWGYDDYYATKFTQTVTLEQTGSSKDGALLQIRRKMYLKNAGLADETLTLTVDDESISAAIKGYGYSPDNDLTITTTAQIVIPSGWVGKEIQWRLETYGKLGTFIFDGYGQFELTLDTANVERTSSPNAEAAVGTLSSGDAIYTDDVLKITAPSGYKLTVNDEAFTSGDNITVKSDVVIVVSAMATLSLYSGGEWDKYLINIYSDGSWGLYQAEVYSGGSWSKYF